MCKSAWCKFVSLTCMQILWEFERMKGEKVTSMKKHLADCLSKIKPGLDVDTKNIDEWQGLFTTFERELLWGHGRAKKPLFPILVSTLCNPKTYYMNARVHAGACIRSFITLHFPV